jgi:hypothetical protein
MIKDFIQKQKTSNLKNYVTPGLESELLVDAKVRFFTMTREQVTMITPHSHRFDFACLVIEGSVRNTIFEEHRDGDKYLVSHIMPRNGGLGQYDFDYKQNYVSTFKATTTEYKKGEWYFMTIQEFHSIQFSHDAFVMFIEGEQKTAGSRTLLPIVDGAAIDIFTTEHWMFKS